MKMNVQQELLFRLDELWPVYAEPGYLQAKYLALGASQLVIHEAHTDANELRVTLERLVEPDMQRVPDWARKLMSPHYTIRHQNRFVRESAELVRFNLGITPVGAPISVQGVGTIKEQKGRSQFEVTFDVNCSIPLVGKKVAEIFSGKIREALLEDCEFTQAYVIEQRS